MESVIKSNSNQSKMRDEIDWLKTQKDMGDGLQFTPMGYLSHVSRKYRATSYLFKTFRTLAIVVNLCKPFHTLANGVRSRRTSAMFPNDVANPSIQLSVSPFMRGVNH